MSLGIIVGIEELDRRIKYEGIKIKIRYRNKG
jgi:hypothetical protein